VDEENQPRTAAAASWRKRTAEYLGLERNVTAASAAVLLMGTGEELWKKFLPKYLEALGAGTVAIGFFGTAKDFFDAIYQYPGGWLADRVGRRRAFITFIALSSIGYTVYLFSSSWQAVFVGLAFAMAWASMGSPAIFAVIGDALPKRKRAIGFTLQSLIKRVPMAGAPLLGGAIIASIGTIRGVRNCLAATLVLAAVAALTVRAIDLPLAAGAPTNLPGVWKTFHGALKKLLISDIIIRTCEGLADVLIVLYVTNIAGVSIAEYGVLVAIQMTTSILVYIPAGKIADRVGRKPFVIATFLCFALFPVAITLSTGFATLALAFVIGGLREIGEPARKAMIVDFAEPHLRGRTVGLYYLIRSLTISPAAAIGGLLWQEAPQMPFLVAGAVGLIGTVVLALTVEEREAG
jgi:MFS family permease